MHGTLDPFDPNHLFVERDYEFRIYGDDREGCWAVVDEVDYQWAIQWKWRLKPSRGGRKFYLYRTARVDGPRQQ